VIREELGGADSIADASGLAQAGRLGLALGGVRSSILRGGQKLHSTRESEAPFYAVLATANVRSLSQPSIPICFAAILVGQSHGQAGYDSASPGLARQPAKEQTRKHRRLCVSVLRQCLSALEYLHRSTPPIVHRDIKPTNLRTVPTLRLHPCQGRAFRTIERLRQHVNHLRLLALSCARNLSESPVYQ